jgi:hypothetical protein
MSNYLFTSESVSEGHPDKVADQISDAVLDAIIKEDPAAHVACETFIKTGVAIVGGEITTDAWVDCERKRSAENIAMGHDWQPLTVAVLQRKDQRAMMLRSVDHQSAVDCPRDCHLRCEWRALAPDTKDYRCVWFAAEKCVVHKIPLPPANRGQHRRRMLLSRNIPSHDPWVCL